MSWQVEEQSISVNAMVPPQHFMGCHCQQNRTADFTESHFKQHLDESLPDVYALAKATPQSHFRAVISKELLKRSYDHWRMFPLL